MRANNPDNAPEKKSAYKSTLETMNDDTLFTVTKDRIWFSAYAANNPYSCFHWQCDFCYDEWKRRGQLDQYSKAWQQVRDETCGS